MARYRVPAIYGYEFGSPGAWWEVGWDEELVSFSAQLLYDADGDDPDLKVPEDDEPMLVVGRRPGEFLEPGELLAGMAEEDSTARIPGSVVEQLKADRNRHVASLDAEGRRALVARVVDQESLTG